jgi:hypothetical protein
VRRGFEIADDCDEWDAMRCDAMRWDLQSRLPRKGRTRSLGSEIVSRRLLKYPMSGVRWMIDGF